MGINTVGSPRVCFFCQQSNAFLDNSTRTFGAVDGQARRVIRIDLFDQCSQCSQAAFTCASGASTDDLQSAHSQGWHHHIAIFGSREHCGGAFFCTQQCSGVMCVPSCVDVRNLLSSKRFAYVTRDVPAASKPRGTTANPINQATIRRIRHLDGKFPRLLSYNISRDLVKAIEGTVNRVHSKPWKRLPLSSIAAARATRFSRQHECF